MMNRRIKVIYILTIFGIVAFCVLQGYWLYQQYNSYLSATAIDMYLEIVEIANEAVNKQAMKEKKDLHAIFRMNNFSRTDTILYSGYIGILDSLTPIDAENTREITEEIDQGLIPEGVEAVYRFENVEGSEVSNKELQEALTRFRVNKTIPFEADSLALDIKQKLGVQATTELVSHTPNRVWKAKVTIPESVFSPKVKVLYPYNPIDGEAVAITADIPIGGTLREMAITLLVALIVATLLITCLVLQIRIIRRQQMIANFQRDYTLTMLHELKRPIGALKLFISFMRNPRLNDNDRQEALENGAKEVDNLASYFEKLRAITYNEAYDVPLTLTTFDLKKAIEECARNSKAVINIKCLGHNTGGNLQPHQQCKETGEELAHDDKAEECSQKECLITAERQSIMNVMANLIENAMKYSSSTSPLDIDIQKKDTSVIMSVSDRGIGISDTDKAKIFQRFYRVPNNKDIPGIGLGLAYVQQIVSAHGGTITVTDRDGGGTVFTITIPQ